MRNHIYNHDKVVIGSTFEAILYSLLNDCLLITNISLEESISYFDFLTPSECQCLGVEESLSLADKDFGYFKLPIARKLLFNLSLRGLLYPCDKVFSLRVEDSILSIQTKDSRLSKIHFEELYIFDEENIVGIPAPKQEKPKLYKVLDWMDVRSGLSHEHEYYSSEDEFVKEIFFYPSDRIDGLNLMRKDVCAISYLKKKQLDKFEYSDTYARFKIQKIMKSLGIRGARNGRSTENPKVYKYMALKMEAAERQLYKCERDIYEDFDNVKFINITIKEIINEKEKDSTEKPLLSRDSPGGRPKIRF
tara:strand:+ start:243 stop:1157 length:915 start_codon:yes stop_codon:yes gene_type:complete